MDDVLRAKAAREEAHAKRDAKRRRAVEDLEARERAASEGGRRGAEAEARERLRVELERLRRRREEATRARGVSGGDASGIGVDARAEVPAHLYRAIKVVWRRASDADEDAYTAKELRETFEKIGRVEDVVIREGKKKKGSALVVFGDEETCVQASRVTCGRPDNALIISRAAVPPEGARVRERRDGRAAERRERRGGERAQSERRRRERGAQGDAARGDRRFRKCRFGTIETRAGARATSRRGGEG